jgi:hypothetical protein
MSKMPGFGAGASLYRSSAHYQVGAMLPGLRQGGEIIPSARRIVDTTAAYYCSCSGDRPNRYCCCCDIRRGCFCIPAPPAAQGAPIVAALAQVTDAVGSVTNEMPSATTHSFESQRGITPLV